MAENSLLRVMTWNLWWRFGHWERRRDPIARILDATAPDIVGLQEVWGGSTENQAHILAETLGMHHVWCPSPAPEQFQRRARDRTVVVGNAILSRWPITRKSVCELPAGASDAGRTALFALIDAPFGALPVFTTQFSSAVGGSELRCKQVGALTQFIAEETRDCANSIVTGDLNAEPDSDEIRLLGGHQTAPPVPGMIFLDVWRFADPGARSCTWDRRNPAVFATGEPDARIDYIFLGHRTNSSFGPRVLSARLRGNEPVNGVWPSDHAAVVAEFEWRATFRTRIAASNRGTAPNAGAAAAAARARSPGCAAGNLREAERRDESAVGLLIAATLEGDKGPVIARDLGLESCAEF